MGLKEEFIDLLERDKEFRYAVAGFLGLDEILKRMDKHEAELVKLREDLNKLREDFNRFSEDANKRMDRHERELISLREELNRLRADMNDGFNLLRRHVDALGARWGLLSEEAFREGMRGIVEKELGLKTVKWVKYDSEGYVFGYPSVVDVDVAMHDDRVILVEVKSHVGRADVYIFKRRAELYEKSVGRRPSRLVMVTPYADEDAVALANLYGVEVYTKV